MRLVNLEISDYLLFHRKILNYRLIWPYWVSAIVGSVVGGDEHHNDAGEVFVVMLGRQARQQHERSATPVFYSEAESSSNPALTTNGHCVLCPSVTLPCLPPLCNFSPFPGLLVLFLFVYKPQPMMVNTTFIYF